MAHSCCVLKGGPLGPFNFCRANSILNLKSNQMLPKVCIPSYNRPDTIKSRTLNFLEQQGYPKDLIYIFVSDETEYLRYQTANPSCNLVVGQPGLKAQRQFISDWLSDDEIYLGLDDDVDGVKTMGKSFLHIVRDGVALLKTRQSGLWGILPNDDGRKFQDSTSSHLAFIIGCCFVCRNHKELRLQGYCETDDYERSILYFLKYARVDRYRGAGVKTEYKGTSGGSREGFAKRKRLAVTYLVTKYPELCSFRYKGNEPDLLLNWRAKIDTYADT